MKRAYLALSFVVLLSGCISNMPADLAVQSIQLVDLYGQDKSLDPGIDLETVAGFKTDQEMFGRLRHGRSNLQQFLLRIELTSETNLRDFTRSKSYTLGVSAYFCDQPGKGDWPGQGYRGLSLPTLFWHGEGLASRGPDRNERQRPPPAQLFIYFFYIKVANDETGWFNIRDEGFDLRHAPRDICFTIGGGNNTGFGYRSNKVIIQKEVIAEALRNLPPGFVD